MTMIEILIKIMNDPRFSYELRQRAWKALCLRCAD